MDVHLHSKPGDHRQLVMMMEMGMVMGMVMRVMVMVMDSTDLSQHSLCLDSDSFNDIDQH